MGANLTAFPSGLSDRFALDYLYLRSFERGAALHNIGAPVDEYGEPFDARHAQGTITVTIDSAHETFGLPFPNHIKIDIDGIEDQVVAGASGTLEDSRLKSLLVEVSNPEHVERMIITLEGKGFRTLPPSGGSNFIFVRE